MPKPKYHSSTNNPPSYSFNTVKRIIGEEKTLLLQKHVKHRHFWVPVKWVSDKQPLCRLLGRAAFLRLVEAYGGELLTLTGTNGYHDEAARLLRTETPIPAIARRFHVSEAKILSIAMAKNIKITQNMVDEEKERQPE